MHTLLFSVIVTIVVIVQPYCRADQSRVLSCGVPGSLTQNRITHGWDADSAEWPWHAAIFRRGTNSNDYICGATLIGQNFVVTAAHCVINRATGQKLNPNLFTVHFGRQYLNESSTQVQERPVKNVIIHPQFLHVGLKNDIALLSLKTEVQFNEYVLPVCLDKLSQIDLKSDDLVGRDGVIVGWGKTESGHVSMTLQTAKMPVIDRIACLNSDPQFFSQLISYGMFCAGYENGTSVCNGDSGSGMFFLEGDRWMLRGIVSFSGLKADKMSCDFHRYAGFTNVQYYVPWIRTIVNDRTSMIDALDASDMGVSSRVYTCNYDSTKSSDCKLSNIHLSQGVTVGFHANNKSPTRVTLQRSYLQFLPKSLIDAFPAMEYVNLANLRIRNFEPNAFKTAANLLSVNLQMNRMEEISRSVFTGARSLEQLDLSSNQIEFIDEFAFDSIGRLKNLNLSRNRIPNLPAFRKNSDLETVNASFNLLHEVSDDHFVSNTRLRSIDFAHNRLTDLDLKQLDASANLETIDLSFNQLKRLHIPKHVRHLFAKNNSIETVSVENCVAETLNLAANNLKNPSAVSNCRLLKLLDLSNNLLQLFSYRFIAQMPLLQSLYLSNNRILEIDLPLRVSTVPDLKILDLSHNLLIYVPPTNAFQKLETLQLNHNELQQFDFSHTNKLQKVYLSSNQWDCSELQGIQVHLNDRDVDSCAEGFRKIQGICCKDYKQAYGELFSDITRNNHIRDRRTMDYLKGLCSVPATNRTLDQQTTEIQENLSKFETLQNNLQAKLDATEQVRLQLSKTYETISESFRSLRAKASAITQIIEHQRILESSADPSLTRNRKSDLEVLQEILTSMVAAVRSSNNSLKDKRQYIANIPSRIRELNRAQPQLEHDIRTMQHTLTRLQHKEESLTLQYNGMSRLVQNIEARGAVTSYREGPQDPRGDFSPERNGPFRYNDASSSTHHRDDPQNGFYSEQSYHYEHYSSNGPVPMGNTW